MGNTPFKLIFDKTLQFLFLFSNADGFYVSARYNLQHGWTVPGCSNAHQAIELYIKAIFKLGHQQEIGHDLIVLLKKYESKETYFAKLLQDSIFSQFLKELSIAYKLFRYGEAGAESNSGEIIKLLDELAYNLRNIYLRNINSPSTKLYMPNNVRLDFLKGNNFFKEENLTNNPLAQMGLPIGEESSEDTLNSNLF